GVLHRSVEWAVDRVRRRQGAHRRLKADRAGPAADRPHRLAVGRQLRKVGGAAAIARIGEPDRTGGDLAVPRQDAQNALADDRFAGPRFADQRDRRGLADAEVDALHRLEAPTRGRKPDAQILDAGQVVHRADPGCMASGSIVSGSRIPTACRLAAVDSLSSRPRSIATAAARRTTWSNPAMRLSRRTRALPAPRSSCIQPLLRSRRVE